ncbi:hypothetical protein D9M68_756970 [compost metagenome]
MSSIADSLSLTISTILGLSAHDRSKSLFPISREISGSASAKDEFCAARSMSRKAERASAVTRARVASCSFLRAINVETMACTSSPSTIGWAIMSSIEKAPFTEVAVFLMICSLEVSAWSLARASPALRPASSLAAAKSLIDASMRLTQACRASSSTASISPLAGILSGWLAQKAFISAFAVE